MKAKELLERVIQVVPHTDVEVDYRRHDIRKRQFEHRSANAKIATTLMTNPRSVIQSEKHSLAAFIQI